jgi:hypothetical protein
MRKRKSLKKDLETYWWPALSAPPQFPCLLRVLLLQGNDADASERSPGVHSPMVCPLANPSPREDARRNRTMNQGRKGERMELLQ